MLPGVNSILSDNFIFFVDAPYYTFLSNQNKGRYLRHQLTILLISDIFIGANKGFIVKTIQSPAENHFIPANTNFEAIRLHTVDVNEETVEDEETERVTPGPVIDREAVSETEKLPIPGKDKGEYVIV